MTDFASTTTNMVRENIDLTLRQCAVLLAATDERLKGQSVAAYALHLGISKPAVTRACDKLAEMNLLKRAASTDDRRKVLIDVTKDGAAMVDRIRGGFLPKAKRASSREKVAA